MILAFPPRESLAPRADPYPMGITDYGDTGTGTTSYETGSFLANATWTSSFGTQGPNISVGAQMTFQLNVNLAFSANGHWFDYWVQDVAFVDTSHGRDSVLDFENNICDFSSPAFCLSTSDVEGNGTVYAAGGNPCEGYYADLVNTRGLFTGYSTFQMMVNASVNARGQPEVRFLYDGGPGWVGFDTATFPWVHTLTDAPAFERVIKMLGAEAILHGHSHKQLVRSLPSVAAKTVNRRVPVLGAPAAAAAIRDPRYRAAYHLVRLQRDGGLWRVEARARGLVLNGDSIGEREALAP